MSTSASSCCALRKADGNDHRRRRRSLYPCAARDRSRPLAFDAHEPRVAPRATDARRAHRETGAARPRANGQGVSPRRARSGEGARQKARRRGAVARSEAIAGLCAVAPRTPDGGHRRALGAQARACVLRLQAAVHESASLLRFAVRAVWRFQLREARANGGPLRPVCADHGIAGEDRLSGRAEAAARGRARYRHDAFSGRRREPLFEGARLPRVPRPAADLRARPAAHAERRSVHALLERTAAAARLHSQQRVSNGAAAGGVF